ncbi:MAG: SDR family oxidoreductase [Nitrososphaeraceae archaeon]
MRKAYVFVTGRSQEKLDKAVKDIGKNVTGVQGNAGNLSDLDRLFEIVKKEKGRIDIIFASAGVGELNNPLGSVTEKGFDDTFNVNVRGTLFTVQKALPLMNDGGQSF